MIGVYIYIFVVFEEWLKLKLRLNKWFYELMLVLNIKDLIMFYFGIWLFNIFWDEMYIKIFLFIVLENVKLKIGLCIR